MSKALELHNKATSIAFLAQQAKAQKNFDEYVKLSGEAFVLESEAALLLRDKLDAEPTRSVLFRSAATLALHCGKVDDAIKMIALALIGNPHEEIKNELFDVLQEISKEAESVFSEGTKENAYLYYLRDKAINLKVSGKSNYFSRAIAVDSIVETLRNVKLSITNYIEVNFKKAFVQQDFNDYHTVLEMVKRDYSPLLVNLSFKSFGASICVDESVMSREHSEKIVKWRENLFETYKAEVIELDYSSEQAITPVLQKYTAEERNLIYNPILDSVRDRNKYRISITDKQFRYVERTLEPISKPVQEVLVPKIQKQEEPAQKVLIQSYAFVDDKTKVKKKGDIIDEHEVEYAEFARTIKEVSIEKEYLVVRAPFEVKIVYKKPDFIIEDSFFEIYTRAESFANIIKSYNRILLELFKNYSKQDDVNLSVDELAIKERLLKTFTFASQP
jgi:hypothetical protein